MPATVPNKLQSHVELPNTHSKRMRVHFEHNISVGVDEAQQDHSWHASGKRWGTAGWPNPLYDRS